MSAAPRRWLRDLAMGARFAVNGGREGWVRTVLTALGVGLGVTLLLITAAWPNAMHNRDARNQARYEVKAHAKSDDTLLLAKTDTFYHGQGVRGRLTQPEGPNAPLPPGVRAYPGPGEMVVSPALEELLGSGDGALLRERLPYRITGTIGDEGLIGASELAYYAGTTELHQGDPIGEFGQVERIGSFGGKALHQPLDPVLLLLVLIVIVVLLTPVVVFVASAARFGGERRDRRLAALRLIGTDGRMTRRIAAGEALAGALLGLVVGAGFFLLARQLARQVELADVSVFPADLDPTPGLLAVVVCAVPAVSVAATLFTLRRVVIEPLGVVRSARPTRRRLWWRLLPPLGGLALLYPMVGQGPDQGDFNQLMVISGTILLLVGVIVLLPWIVETVISRLHRGPVSWQLAVRRLQLSSGTAARMVNGVVVAVAGAIALQMLFSALQSGYTQTTAYSTRTAVDRAQMQVNLPTGTPLATTDRALRAIDGVRDTVATGWAAMAQGAKDEYAAMDLFVADCTTLREFADLPGCHDGDSFSVDERRQPGPPFEISGTLYVSARKEGRSGHQVPWRPAKPPTRAVSRTDPANTFGLGVVLATPGALPKSVRAQLAGRVYVQVDPSVPDAPERVRTAAARSGALATTEERTSVSESAQFASIRTGLFAGAALVLILIGASLLVSQLEQLRERRKLLASLVAFGTRRRTLTLSVLWQTAIPVVLGLLLASATGLVLGGVLLRMVQAPVSVDWASVGSLTGMGALVVLAVTVLSMPALVRMMRADGLRTE